MPKSASFTWSLVGEEDVGRLDVAMDDAVVVGVLERAAELDGDVGDLAPVEAPAGLELVFEAAAVDQLHRIEEDAVLLAVAVEPDDAFVAERFERFDLGLEAFAEALGLCQVRAEGLDRDVLAGLRVGRLRRPSPCRLCRSGGRSNMDQVE